MKLKSNRIVVTGAAQGIGASGNSGFAELGAQVALCDIPDVTEAVRVIASRGHDALAVQSDVTKLED